MQNSLTSGARLAYKRKTALKGRVSDPAASGFGMQIEIRHADLVTFEGDGIIVPTTSDGIMAEGVASRIRAAAGREVETEAVKFAPIAVGASIGTTAGKLPVKHIIHAPIVEKTGMRVGIENIRRATRAGLLAATHFQLERIGIPGMGTGENGVPLDEAARAIIDEVRAYRGGKPSLVVLMDTDPEMVEAFSTELLDH
jgi:O-acetyl-ADP-ribose deacetylase (regulator of RNase III)